MQLLSALTSTTSPFAMQAMPVVAQPTADFAGLLAGMVPAEAAAVPEVRQIAALPGNALPLPVAVPDAIVATPTLPVSATEAVSMLSADAAEPQVVPIVAAAFGVLRTLLPDEDAPPPPEPATLAVPVLPTPPRFAAPVARGRKPEAEMPRERPAETADDGDAETVPSAEADATPLPARIPVVDIVVPVNEVAVRDVVLPTPPPREAAPSQTILEDGSVIATDPTAPMRPAKRPTPRTADTIVPAPAVPKDASVVATDPTTPMRLTTRSTPRATDAIAPTSAMPMAPVMPQAVDARAGDRPAQAPSREAVPADPMIAPVAAAPVPANRAAPASGITSRPAEPVPATARPAPAGSQRVQEVTPPLGRIVPLQADGVVPVHVVVPPPSDTTPATAIPDRFTIGSMPRGREALPPGVEAVVAPTADVVPEPLPADTPPVVDAAGLSGGTAASIRQRVPMPIIAQSTPVTATVRPSHTGSIPAAPKGVLSAPAPASPSDAGDTVAAPTPVMSTIPVAFPADPAVAAATMPTTPANPASSEHQPVAAAPGPVAASNPAENRVAAPPTVAAETPTAGQTVPQPVAGMALQTPRDPLIDGTPRATDIRQPIAGEAAAPVVSVAAPTEPVAKPLPVTRIAMPAAHAEPVAAPLVVDAAAPPSRTRRDEDAPSLPTAAAAPDPVVLRPVAAPAQAGQPTLDTRQPQWIEGMIDRIETLRDVAGTNGETRIRLSPDALGDVEIAIRTSDDGKVHVHFNSENADAGRLLADAQPRLVQLAEARGLKLGGMQVDVGTQQQSQRQAPEQGNAPPRAPRPATTSAGQPSTNDNQRIA